MLMCGRYGFIPGKDFYDRFEITNRDFDLQTSYNVAPGRTMPVVVMNSPKKITLMRWGLIPFWAKDPRIGYRTINARAEDVSNRPSYRRAFKNQRCLVPASGFYEWKAGEKKKTPYYFRKKGGEMMAFAGLFDIWKDGEGEEHKTYTIITTAAGKLLKEVHDRMPVILSKESEDIWADNIKYTGEELRDLMKPDEKNELIGYEVATRVNNTANDYPELIDQIKKGDF